VPSAASPSAQKWNDIGADVILAKKFKRLVRRWITLVSEGGDSLLPCRHAVSISPVVKEFVRGYSAAVAAQRSYIPNSEDQMAFKPNYGRDRAERARTARARSEDKKRKKDEKTALRKAQRGEAELLTNQSSTEEKQN
jgi:hypothetical protein